MGATAAKLPAPMSVDDFLAWQSGQDSRYELVDGIPVEMMSGASGAHDDIVVNIIAVLRQQLSGKRCRVRTADTAVRTSVRGLRRADVLVTCQPSRADDYVALKPRLVVEVLSPSNHGLSWERKLREYRRHPDLQYILLIDPAAIGVTLYSRTEQGWEDLDADAITDSVALPLIECRLPLAEVYAGTGLADPGAEPAASEG